MAKLKSKQEICTFIIRNDISPLQLRRIWCGDNLIRGTEALKSLTETPLPPAASPAFCPGYTLFDPMFSLRRGY